MGPVCTTERPSPTQMQVLALCAQGKSREEIGRALFLSPWTVKNYLDRARDRLGAVNVTHALAICMVREYLRVDPVLGEVVVTEITARELVEAA